MVKIVIPEALLHNSSEIKARMANMEQIKTQKHQGNRRHYDNLTKSYGRKLDDEHQKTIICY